MDLDQLRAAIDEDERVANWALTQSAEMAEWWWADPDPDSGAEHHIARQDPARVLRWVRAVREILGLRENVPTETALSSFTRGQDDGFRQALDEAISRLASVYGDTDG